jgi:hypothetical protein
LTFPGERSHPYQHEMKSIAFHILERTKIMGTYFKNLREVLWLTCILGPLFWLVALPAHAAVPSGRGSN